MKQSIRFGRVAGVQVGAHWSVAVILFIIAEMLAMSVLPSASRHQPAAVYWAVASAAAVLFVASLLAHELAHAIVARRNGVGVRSITLWMLGGVAELEADPPSAGADLRIALAGPATSLLTGAVFFGAGVAADALGGPRVAIAAVMWLGVMNGFLAIFNLLPGAPLDGGRVLRALLWRHHGNRERADKGAARAGQVLGALIGGLGIAELLVLRYIGGLWLVLIGWFLVTAAIAEEKATAAKSALAGMRVADVMIAQPELGYSWETGSEFTTRAAAWSRQDAFPVVGFESGLIGVVLTSQLARMSAGERDRLRLSQVALPVPPDYRVAPDDPAGQLLTRRPLGGEVAAVVVADGDVLGLVRVGDLERAVRRRTLVGARP